MAQIKLCSLPEAANRMCEWINYQGNVSGDGSIYPLQTCDVYALHNVIYKPRVCIYARIVQEHTCQYQKVTLKIVELKI